MPLLLPLQAVAPVIASHPTLELLAIELPTAPLLASEEETGGKKSGGGAQGKGSAGNLNGVANGPATPAKASAQLPTAMVRRGRGTDVLWREVAAPVD